MITGELVTRGTSTAAKLFYTLALIGAALGVVVGVLGAIAAPAGAPTAAAAAIGCVLTIAPYVVACCVDKLTS